MKDMKPSGNIHLYKGMTLRYIHDIQDVTLLTSASPREAATIIRRVGDEMERVSAFIWSGESDFNWQRVKHSAKVPGLLFIYWCQYPLFLARRQPGPEKLVTALFYLYL